MILWSIFATLWAISALICIVSTIIDATHPISGISFVFMWIFCLLQYVV